MDFSIQKDDSYTYIRVLNEKLDYLMAPGLKSELVLIVANGEMNILVDLSGCNFCDSSGLSALLLGNRLCRDVNGKFILYGCTGQVSEMLDLADLGNHLTVAETKDEACSFFTSLH